MSLSALPALPIATMQDAGDVMQDRGTKRPRDDDDDESSVGQARSLDDQEALSISAGNAQGFGLDLLAPIPKRPRSSPSNQIHEAIFACPVASCATNYTRRSNLKNHLITKHADLQPRKAFPEVFRRKPKCKPGQRQSPPLLNKAAKCTHEGCGKTFPNDRALAAHVAESHEDVLGAILGMLSMKSNPNAPNGLTSGLPRYAHELLAPMEITPTYEDGLLDAMPKVKTPELPRSRSPASTPSPILPPSLLMAQPPQFMPLPPMAQSQQQQQQSGSLPSFQTILSAPSANSTGFSQAMPSHMGGLVESTASARFLSTFATPELLTFPSSAANMNPNLTHTYGMPSLTAMYGFNNFAAHDFLRKSQQDAQAQTSGFPSTPSFAQSASKF